MILTDTIENKATLSSSITETNTFSIKNSAKAFYILSTSLYSDPMLAILRELGCNARDSHVEAGQTRPWRLHLPTVINPMLEIEDYGVGLEHSQVMNMFTTFFESTKTGSNEFVGALGLGSKSPFSYTDNYTVVAVKDGIRNVYSAYKTDDGLPAIARMHTEKTDSGNGVMIQIAVKSSDFSNFESRAIHAFRFFDVMPTCNKPLQNYITKVGMWEPSGVKTGYEQFKTNGPGPVIVMGGVGYPFDKNRKEFAKYLPISKSNIILRANIGDVEMTPSREGLTYNKQTIDWIASKLEEIHLKLEVYAEATISGIDDIWSKAVHIKRMEKDTVLGQVAQSLSKKHFPNGYPELSISATALLQHGISIRRFVQNHNTNRYKASNFDSGSDHILISLQREPFYRNNETDLRDSISFVLNDDKSRVMDITNTRFTKNVYLLTVDKKVCSVDTAKAFIESKFNEFGFKLELASTFFTKAPKEERVKTSYYSFYMGESGGYYSSRKVLKNKRETGSVPSSVKYWVQMENGKISAPDKHSTAIKSIFEDLHVTQFASKRPNSIVGFSKSNIEKAPTKGLINIYDHLEKEIQSELARAKTDSGLMELVAQYLHESSYISICDIPKNEIPKIMDPVLKTLVKAKSQEVDKFKWANDVKRHPDISGKYRTLVQEMSDHVQRNYSELNMAKYTGNLVGLINFLYSSRTTTKNVV